MNADVAVSPARPEHVEAIVGLLDEMDQFYGATDIEPNQQRMRNVRDALFSAQPAAYVLLAWNRSGLVGLASYSFVWPASGSSRSLYLKELYVTDSCRGEGVGRLLMDHLCRVAVEYGCSRLEWTTDDDNLGAQQFYKRLGFDPDPSKIFYRLEGDCLRRRADASRAS